MEVFLSIDRGAPGGEGKRAEQYRSSLYTGIVGDAMGVPSDNTGNEDGTLRSVKNMLGYGRFDHPSGTWSDDTSLTLCTMESLSRGYNIEDLGRAFCSWLFDSKWTPDGYVQDAGLTTFMALDNLSTERKSALESGCGTEDDNGNGSLMRILPAALFFSRLPVPAFLDRIHELSAITHSHARARLGCGLYALIVREMLDEPDGLKAYASAMKKALDHYNGVESFRLELPHFKRVTSCEVPSLAESAVQSSGYVVDTLESALWCFFHHDQTRDVLVTAVRMGLETDTTGMVAGGLTGLRNGMSGIPQDLLNVLARKAEIDTLIGEFVTAAIAKGPAA